MDFTTVRTVLGALLTQLQIAKSATPRKVPAGFRPIPFLGSPHVQTVLAVYLKGGKLPGHTSSRTVQMPDEDCFVLHDTRPTHWQPGDPVVVILHGLAGSSESGGIRRLAKLMVQRGVRAVRMDMRGAGSGLRLAKGFYHAGCTHDVRAAISDVVDHCPGSPLYLAGVSLGGNIALNVAGQLAEHPIPQLERVAVIAPPIDLAACVKKIRLPKNRLYEAHFLQELLAGARRRFKLHGGDQLPRWPKPLNIRDFDELYTAPRNGFLGADDYYEQSSSIRRIANIALPTLILASLDDPIVDISPLENAVLPANVELRLTRHGGHVGYIGLDGAGGISWGEQMIANWLTWR